MRRVTADNPFPVITLIQSVKLWQKSYFYVKNFAPQGDYVNLPAGDVDAGWSCGCRPTAGDDPVGGPGWA